MPSRFEGRTTDGLTNAPEFPSDAQWLNTTSPLRLKDLRGKFVLLDFWTYCCINCLHVLPELQRLEEKYREELVVIGVHAPKFVSEKDTCQLKHALHRYDIVHPVVNDADHKISDRFATRSWPTLILIGPNGKILGQFSGEGNFDTLDEILAEQIPYFTQAGLLVLTQSKSAQNREIGTATTLRFPEKVSADTARGRLIVSDSGHDRLLIVGTDGCVVDVIGSGAKGWRDGSFESAQFRRPLGTVCDGNRIYIADAENHLIRIAHIEERRVETVLGTGDQARRLNLAGRGLQVSLNSPWDLTVAQGRLFIAMTGFHQIWTADLKTWEAAPLIGSGQENIGDGPLLDAALAQPSGLTTDGMSLYFADSESSAIRVADIQNGGGVRTVVGKGLFEYGDVDGPPRKARLQHPLGITWMDGFLYIADTYNCKIKKVDPARPVVGTWAGNGKKGFTNGDFSHCSFNEPGGLAWLDGRLYVCDINNHAIRVLDPLRGVVESLDVNVPQ